MKAIVGLGNPGSEYERTRHNAGWMLLDRLAARGRVLEEREKEFVRLQKLKLGPDSVWLVRSKTYMNSSGLGVEQACRSLGIGAGDLLLAYDEIDLPLGQLRIRRRGGSGGHRGVESVVEEMGTGSIPRLRLGVAGSGRSRDAAGYVLAEFEPEEIELLDEMLDRGLAAVRMALRRGIGVAMNAYNKKPEALRPTDTTATDSGSAPDDRTSSDKEHRE